MNQQNSKLPTSRIQGMYRKWALISFILSTVAASLIFTLAYNAQTGYISSTIAGILLPALVIAEITTAAVIVRSTPIYINEGNRTTLSLLTTLFLHIIVIFCGVMASIGCKDAHFSIDSISKISSSPFLPSYILRGLLLISAVTVFLSSPALRKSNGSFSISSQINGYSTIFLCITGIALLYFNMSVEMNNPQKLYLQFSLAAICLTKLFELKSHIQNKGSRLCSFFKISSIAIAPISAISTFIAFAEKGKNFPTIYLYLAIAVSVYAIAHVIEITFFTNTESSEISENSEINESSESTKNTPSTESTENKE